ncbi:undecaprenyl-phosphate glucose phosphotransferase [Rhizobium sp. YJ-22]|uniref:undecaprenyl-phosphate glucose phosphotransferase n=1 Tax=Rhizobium sp. YJ-22 TaxID=3037556 RepID=UPI002412757B|nr:undecaprenyl-phosphate glucose phosphotransferase [Rhizobium sp. YJ-22]MDG3577194.1 undecaprenyl-phosphate glucose phosphotransferase [Rhizobium sp. YJ-22]
MNQIQKSDEFDLEAIRQKIWQESAAVRDSEAPPASESVPLNAFARQIAEQFRQTSYTPNLLIGQLRLLEFLALLAIGMGIHAWYNPWQSPFSPLTLLFMLIGAGAAVLFLHVMDTYQVQALRASFKTLPKVMSAWGIAFGLIALALFLLKSGGDHSRLWFVAWFVTGAVYLTVERSLVSYGVRHWARNGTMERRAVIVGGGQPAKDLIRALEQQPENDIRICGIFDDRNETRSPSMVAGYPKLGTVAELVEFARLARIDMLIISLPLSAEARILQLLKKLWVLPLDIRLAAHANKLRFRPRAYSKVGAVPMLDIFDRPIRDWDSVAKRIFDVTFSLIALALLWPIMLGAALAVKLTSKGPIIFMQKRHGFNNEIINVFKFRSMYTEMSDPTARNAVTKNDPRVTPVGRFIRKTSIDELPQIFNVLRGDLSLVGPRPHAVLAQTHDRLYVDVVEGYFARHRVKPGVTGWAQINGWRGEVDNDDKIKFRTAYDLYYIENWSLLLDLKILFLTPFRLLNTENAY